MVPGPYSDSTVRGADRMPASTVHEPSRFVRTALLVDDQALAGLEPDGEDVHPVPSNEIVQVLADAGLSCTILAPESPDDPDRSRVVALARSADIVILDWTLPGALDGSRNTLPI